MQESWPNEKPLWPEATVNRIFFIVFIAALQKKFPWSGFLIEKALCASNVRLFCERSESHWVVGGNLNNWMPFIFIMLFYSPLDSVSIQGECLGKCQYFSCCIEPESSRHLGNAHQVLLQFIKKKSINVDFKLFPRHWRALGMVRFKALADNIETWLLHYVGRLHSQMVHRPGL